MLKCKEVARLASDYIDQNTPTKITWQMRLHLMVCANCHRFVRHLRITKLVAVKLAKPDAVNTEVILKKIKERTVVR